MTPSATDDTQRASLTLSDGSEIEIAVRTQPGRPAPDLAPLLALLRAQLERRAPETLAAFELCPGIVGQSQAMRELTRKLRKVAKSDATVLLIGENGTGKELVARALHTLSQRAAGPFVAANCSAFNDNLLESELFGHRRGAFTGAVSHKRGLFEEADGGTFLLDEVGDMSPALQAKLLRVLQEGAFLPVGATQLKRVDVRIVAATNRNLQAMVAAKTFREDLYYRLNVVALRPPPLRERGDDLNLLIDHFMEGLAARHGQRKQLHPATRARLCAHSWPGNVRELQNELERIWVLAGDAENIEPEHLSPALSALTLAPAQPDAEAAGADESLPELLARVERERIEEALREARGNRTRAAERLGISRRHLLRKLEQYG